MEQIFHSKPLELTSPILANNLTIDHQKKSLGAPVTPSFREIFPDRSKENS